MESQGKEGKIMQFSVQFVRSHGFCALINLFSSLSPVRIPHIVVKWVRLVPFPTFATLLPSSTYSPSYFLLILPLVFIILTLVFTHSSLVFLFFLSRFPFSLLLDPWAFFQRFQRTADFFKLLRCQHACKSAPA